jgi:PAS domain S-box-containing protein
MESPILSPEKAYISASSLKTLRVSESRYRRLFETARDGILILNADTAQIDDVNPYLVELLGYSYEEFLGKKLWEVGTFADTAESKEMFERLRTDGYVRYDDIPLRTKAGAQIPVEFVSNTYDCAGIKVIQCNIRNITERKQIEAERRRLLNIIEDATDFISTADMEGHIKTLNAAGARMVGLPDGVDVTTLDIRDFHPDWAARRISEEAIPAVLKHGFWQGECALLHRNGHTIPTSQLVLVHRDDSGKPAYMSTIIRDVTDYKQAESELKRSNAELEQFSYAISHDMRQPLRMISSYMQLLKSGLDGQLDSKRREYFDFAIGGAKRLDQMLVGLLDYSRVGLRGEPPAWIDSRVVLDDALRFLQPAIAEAQADIRIKGEWPRLHVSPDEMLRLVLNLIGNAVKFRVAGRKPEVTVTSETAGKEWGLCVADNGVGILPDQIGRLFQVFQRLQSRANYEGTGIGLALCRRISEHHGGRVWAESAGDKKGSRFYVALPLERVETHV